MEEQFVTYEIALKLKELGFNAPCIACYTFPIKPELPILTGHYVNSFKKYYNSKLKEINVAAPLWQQAIDWFREEHRFHIQINPIAYLNFTKTAYFFSILSDDPDKPIYDFQDKYEEVLDAAYQDVPGNYVNDELYDKNLFDLHFAYIIYNQCNEQAILKAITLLKEKQQC